MALQKGPTDTDTQVLPGREFFADLHVHVDSLRAQELPKEQHGITIEDAAGAIALLFLQNRMQIAALTAHNQIPFRQYHEIREQIERILAAHQARSHQEITDTLLLLLSTETTTRVSHEGRRAKFHLAYLYEGKPSCSRKARNIMPPRKISFDPDGTIPQIEEYRARFPGRVIGCHFATSIQGAKNPQDAEFLARRMAESQSLSGAELGRPISWRDPDVRNRLSKTGGIIHRAHATHPDLAPIGASDAHRAQNIGQAVTTFRGRHPGEIFEAIDSGRTGVLIRTKQRQVVHSLLKVLKSIPGLDKALKFEIIH